MAIDWKIVEDAVRVAILAAAQYTDDRVIYKNENANQPAIGVDYIGMYLTSVIGLGQDAVTDSTDLGQPAGEEIEIKVSGDREFGVQVEAYTVSTNAEITARATLSKMQTRLALPSIREALRAAASVSIFDFGDVQYLPAIHLTKFKGRAITVLRCYVRDDASERTGYIASVEIMDLTSGNVILVE